MTSHSHDLLLLLRDNAPAGCTNPKDCNNVPPPTCKCKANEECVFVGRTCYECTTTQCIPKGGSGNSVNPGVIIGPVVGALLLVASLVLFWFLRRKKKRDLARLEGLAERARKGESSAFHLSSPSASPVATVRHKSRHASQMTPQSPTSSQNTGRSSGGHPGALPHLSSDHEYRDHNGNTVRVYTGKRGAINADPNHPDNGGSGDPFGDQNSMQTDRADSGHSTNIIPIHYVPGTDTVLMRNGQPASQSQQAAAARTLDQARQNLWRPGPRTGVVPPPRPARAPDLDLRLQPMRQGLPHPDVMSEVSSRDSFISAISAAPSFMSGNTADLHLDVPKIMTRQQVHVGRLHAAEVVQFGNHPSTVPEDPAELRDGSPGSPGSNPFSEKSAEERLDLPSPSGSQSTFSDAVVTTAHVVPHFGGPAAQSTTSLDSQRYDDEEGMLSQPSPTDLRFSMGSLAYDRTSVSTQGTSQRGHFLPSEDQPPVPSLPPGVAAGRPRFESISSYKSTGNDSLLGSFPMIPPPGAASSSQDAGPRAPPVSFKSPAQGSTPSGRPLTAASAHSAHSMADSFLGSFPFVPPNVDSTGAPSPTPPMPALPTQRVMGPNPSRLTLGMSSVSEGLGDFEFSFDDRGEGPSVSRQN